MGRKAISGVPKSERPLRIRLTDLEREMLDQAAGREGKSTSTWARDLLLGRARAGRAEKSKKGTG